MDPRQEHEESNWNRLPQNRVIFDREILFMFIYMLCDPNESGEGIEGIAFGYGVMNGTVSKYIIGTVYLPSTGPFGMLTKT